MRSNRSSSNTQKELLNRIDSVHNTNILNDNKYLKPNSNLKYRKNQKVNWYY